MWGLFKIGLASRVLCALGECLLPLARPPARPSLPVELTDSSPLTAASAAALVYMARDKQV